MTESVPEDSGQWIGGRRWTGLAAVAVVLLTVTALVAWLLRDDGGVPPPPAAAPGTTAPTSGSATVPGAIVDNDDQTIPRTTPSDVTWQVWHGLALPFSTSAGPARVDGQAVSGFAHTPTGALLAYSQASGRIIGATDSDWRAVFTTMIAPGQGREDAMKARAAHSMPDPPGAGSFAQSAGFRFMSYTPADAVLQMASRDPRSGAYQSVVGHVRWVDGDWKIILSPHGTPSTKKVIPSLDGFIPWGGI